MKIQAYLDDLGGGTTHADFVRQHPHFVLIEVDAAETELALENAMTERLEPGAVQRQTQASRDAEVVVLRLEGPEDAVLVGRAPHCAIVLEHPSVSKEHARFGRRPEGGLRLDDLGSTNGTFVNVRRLDPGQAVPVSPDDVLRFGEATGFHLLDPDGFFHYLGLIRRFGL